MVGVGKAPKPMTNAEKNAMKDPHSGLYIVNPVLSIDALNERMMGRRHISVSTIPLHMRGGQIEGVLML